MTTEATIQPGDTVYFNAPGPTRGRVTATTSTSVTAEVELFGSPGRTETLKMHRDEVLGFSPARAER